jgi:thioesterase domain-containing protein
MSTQSLPTLLLVHGGGHGNPAYLTEFQGQLKKAGIPSVTYRAPSEVGLPSLPVAGRAMYDDAVFWREKITTLADAGEDIVLLGHSIGSVVATEAAQGLTKTERQKQGLQGGVVHLIFLAAYLSAEGDSVFTFYEKYPIPTRAAFDNVCMHLFDNIHLGFSTR